MGALMVTVEARYGDGEWITVAGIVTRRAAEAIIARRKVGDVHMVRPPKYRITDYVSGGAS